MVQAKIHLCVLNSPFTILHFFKEFFWGEIYSLIHKTSSTGPVFHTLSNILEQLWLKVPSVVGQLACLQDHEEFFLSLLYSVLFFTHVQRLRKDINHLNGYTCIRVLVRDLGLLI